MWRIEKATYELHSLILEAVEEVVQSDYLLEQFGIPSELWADIRRSWEERETDLLGRFDFLWDGKGIPKMAEYNADTPTVLIESAAAQKQWHMETKLNKTNYGQFNVIEEALIDAWQKILKEQERQEETPPESTITFATQGASFWNDPNVFAGSNTSHDRNWIFGYTIDSINSKYCFQEEATTGQYMNKLASIAAAKAAATNNAPKLELVDFDSLQPNDLIDKSLGGVLWKLYPWEWLIHEDIGKEFGHGHGHDSLQQQQCRRKIIEPSWKLVASSKAMLAYLWRKHPHHPNLLPAAMAEELIDVDGTEPAKNWVAKPALGREGTGLQYGDDFAVTANSSDGTTLYDFVAKIIKEAGGAGGAGGGLTSLELPKLHQPPLLLLQHFNKIMVLV